MALLMITDVVRFVIALTPDPDLALYMALVEMKILLHGITIAAFLAFILYGWTGRSGVGWIAASIGITYSLFFTFLTVSAGPRRYIIGAWGARMEYGPVPLVPGGTVMALVLWFLPMIVAIVAYLAFWRHVGNRGQQARLVAVATALILYLVGATVQASPAVDPDTLAIPMATGLFALAGVIAWQAFYPAAGVQRRLGIRPYEDFRATSATTIPQDPRR